MVLMSDVWVSQFELSEAIGDVGAVILCAQCGGRSYFIPRKPTGFLLELLGRQRMAALCTEFGGMQIVVPNLRRGEPFKGRILSRLEAGEKADAIAEAAGADTAMFHTCHNVTPEELAGGETYVSLMKQNLERLKAHMG